MCSFLLEDSHKKKKCLEYTFGNALLFQEFHFPVCGHKANWHLFLLAVETSTGILISKLMKSINWRSLILQDLVFVLFVRLSYSECCTQLSVAVLSGNTTLKRRCFCFYMKRWHNVIFWFLYGTTKSEFISEFVLQDVCVFYLLFKTNIPIQIWFW